MSLRLDQADCSSTSLRTPGRLFLYKLANGTDDVLNLKLSPIVAYKMPYRVNASLPPVFTHDLAIGSKLVVFRLGITKFWHAKIVFSNLSGAHAIAPTRVEDRCCCTWSVT